MHESGQTTNFSWDEPNFNLGRPKSSEDRVEDASKRSTESDQKAVLIKILPKYKFLIY